MLSVSFFSLQSVSMTLAQRYEWSGTPFKAGLSPAAAHSEGFNKPKDSGFAHAAEPPGSTENQTKQTQ